MSDPLTPYGNRPMVTPIVNAVNYEYRDFEVLRQITNGEIEGYTYHRDDNPTVRAVEKMIAELEGARRATTARHSSTTTAARRRRRLSSGSSRRCCHCPKERRACQKQPQKKRRSVTP